MAWKGAKPPRGCGAEGDRALEGLSQKQGLVLVIIFVKEESASQRKKNPRQDFYPDGAFLYNHCTYASKLFQNYREAWQVRAITSSCCSFVRLIKRTA